MERYIGIKEVNAKPMTLGDYNNFRGWITTQDRVADEGFLVEYVDGGSANTELYSGYVSWSPSDVFKRAYKPVADMPVYELTPEQVGAAFRTIMLTENYNFLEEDLVALANAFVKAAAPIISKVERNKCLDIARSVNHLVATRIEQVRGQE